MTFGQWLPLAMVCLLGAMSPGPSLAMVVRHGSAGGVSAGAACAVLHGLGIFFWALLMVSGLGAVILSKPAWLDMIRVFGALLLFYWGVRGLFGQGDGHHSQDPGQEDDRHLRAMAQGATALASSGQAGSQATRVARAGWEGFLIALSNPKIALFFAALFSQFVQADAPLATHLLIAATAAVIDAAWYVLVVVILAYAASTFRLQGGAIWVQRGFGVLLMALAIAMFQSVFT